MSYYCHPLNEKYLIKGTTHDGHTISDLDFACSIGTPVYSMCNGTVEQIYRPPSTAGNAIIIKANNTNWNKKFNNDIYFRYLHLSEIKVEIGQDINIGELIGLSGNTGTSSAPHLHVDIRFGEDGSSGFPMLRPDQFNNDIGTLKQYYAPEINGNVDATDETYDNYGSYTRAIFAQPIQATFIQAGVLGGIKLEPNQDTIGIMERDGLFYNFYLDYAFIDDFMGQQPRDLSDIVGTNLNNEQLENCPCLFWAYMCLHEFNTIISGINAVIYGTNTPEYNNSLMWSKAIRLVHIYSPQFLGHNSENLEKLNFLLTDDGKDAMKQFIGTGENLIEELKSLEITQQFLDFAQLVYLNIKYPYVFGIEDSPAEVGISRFYALAAGIVSNNNNGHGGFLQEQGIYYHYKYKQEMSGNLPAIMWSGAYYEMDYTDERNFNRNIDNIMTIDFIPQSSTSEGRLGVDASSLVGLNQDEAANALNTSFGDYYTDWCAMFAHSFTLKSNVLGAYAEEITPSTSQTITNLIRKKGCKYYIGGYQDLYSVDNIELSSPGNIFLEYIQPGDIICFDWADTLDDVSDEEAKSNRYWDHTAIVLSVEGNTIKTLNGNWASNGDRIVAIVDFTVNNNGTMSNGVRHFVILHLDN